jgi:hypothetical protein
MRCSLFSSDGPLMSTGECEFQEDSIRMVAHEWHLSPTVNGAPLMLVADGGKQYPVAVLEVHVRDIGSDRGPVEVYELRSLAEEKEHQGGVLAGLKSLFSR